TGSGRTSRRWSSTTNGSPNTWTSQSAPWNCSWMPWSVRSAFTDTERFANMSRLRAATSIFFAVQQVCKGKTDAYKPIPEAVMDVRMGVYASTQGNSGNDNDHGVNANGVG